MLCYVILCHDMTLYVMLCVCENSVFLEVHCITWLAASRKRVVISSWSSSPTENDCRRHDRCFPATETLTFPGDPRSPSPERRQKGKGGLVTLDPSVHPAVVIGQLLPGTTNKRYTCIFLRNIRTKMAALQRVPVTRRRSTILSLFLNCY